MSAYQALELSTLFSMLLCICQALGSVTVETVFVTHRWKMIVTGPMSANEVHWVYMLQASGQQLPAALHTCLRHGSSDSWLRTH